MTNKFGEQEAVDKRAAAADREESAREDEREVFPEGHEKSN